MDVLLTVDPSRETPLHRQVYDAIRSAILAGRLRPGDRLPATRSLAEELSLSRQTVSEAYDQLQSEGYLQGRQGSGTYVAPDLPEATLQTASVGRAQTRQSSPPRLSSWGARIALAERRQEAGRGSYDLRPHRVAADAFPWDAWAAAVDRALSTARGDLLAVPPAAGHSGLRDAIASHVMAYRAVTCTPDQVVVVNGSQQGLSLLTHLLLDPGDRVAVEDPGYPSARLAFEAQGLAVSRIPVDGEGMVVERLVEQTPGRMIHVTPSHQDPTGATLSLTRRLALLDIAERRRALIVEDDYDSEFRYEGRPVESLQGLDRSDLVIYAGTFSKSVFPGLRIGFMVLPHPLVGPFVAAKQLWDSGTPMLEQAALAEFMRSGDYERHIRRMRRLYRSRRDALLDSLSRHFGDRASVGPRHGGLNVLVALDVPRSAEELARVAEADGILLRPVTAYYAEPPVRPTFLIGFAAPEEEIDRAIGRLAGIAGDL